MNLQKLHDLVKNQRNENFANSSQITLGELITEFEKYGVTDEEGKPKELCFDFGSAVPLYLDSWRGNYAELAIA